MTRTALILLTVAAVCLVAAAAWFSPKVGLLTLAGVFAAAGVLNLEVNE